jgi:uncharacterized membrane protein (DUF2068 family)
VRFVEAYGLWHARAWAKWLAGASAAIYVPFEVAELYARVTWLALGALTVNVVIVGMML